MPRVTSIPDERIQKIVDSLDCLTEEDFKAVAKITDGTAVQWRSSGKGPAFVRLGNRVLYPRKAVAEFLEARIVENTAQRKSLL